MHASGVAVGESPARCSRARVGDMNARGERDCDRDCRRPDQVDINQGRGARSDCTLLPSALPLAIWTRSLSRSATSIYLRNMHSGPPLCRTISRESDNFASTNNVKLAHKRDPLRLGLPSVFSRVFKSSVGHRTLPYNHWQIFKWTRGVRSPLRPGSQQVQSFWGVLFSTSFIRKQVSQFYVAALPPPVKSLEYP
jgi:hypothetical protein